MTVSAPPPPKPTTTVVLVPPSRMVQEIHRFLEPEIRAGLVEVSETAQQITVHLAGAGMFDSGRAEVRPEYLHTLDAIGEALKDQPGEVTITGHTDSVKPSVNARYSTNLLLSQARAEAVRAILASHLPTPERLRTEGRADWEQIDKSGSEEGNRKNRRIELILIKGRGTPS